MLTQNSKGKASRDGQRLRHRGQGGDRYTGLGKVQGTKIQREFTDNQQKKTPNYQYLALCSCQWVGRGWILGWGGSVTVCVCDSGRGTRKFYSTCD